MRGKPSVVTGFPETVQIAQKKLHGVKLDNCRPKGFHGPLGKIEIPGIAKKADDRFHNPDCL